MAWQPWECLCSDLGRSSKAIEFYEQALDIAREIGDHKRVKEQCILDNLGKCVL